MFSWIGARSISPATVTEILSEVWRVSADLFEKKEYREARDWLCDVLFFLQKESNSEGANKVRAFRALALACFLLQEYTEASRWIGEALKLDSLSKKSMLLSALMFMKTDQPAAVGIFHELVKLKSLGPEELALLADESAKADCGQITLQAFEGVAESIKSGAEGVTDVDKLSLYHNLIHLASKYVSLTKLDGKVSGDAATKEDFDTEAKIESWLSLIVKELTQQVPAQGHESAAQTSEETSEKTYIDQMQWFAQMAFNAGLRHGAKRMFPLAISVFETSHTLFAKLDALKADDPTLAQHAKISLILSIGAALEAAWASPADRIRYAQIAVNGTVRWLRLYRQPQDKAAVSVKLSLFKAYLFLDDERSVSALEDVAHCHGVTERALDTCSHLATELGKVPVAMRAVELALQLHLYGLIGGEGVGRGFNAGPGRIGNFEGSIVAKRFRVLLTMCTDENRLAYLDDLLGVLHTHPQAPALKESYKLHSEGQWLVSLAWNKGVYYYRKREIKFSESYLSRAISIYQTLLNSTSKHFQVMSQSYAHVIEQLNQQNQSSGPLRQNNGVNRCTSSAGSL